MFTSFTDDFVLRFGGYMRKILIVNLATREFTIEEPDEQFYRHFLGGYGIGARFIYSHQKPHIDPLGSESILGFATGPLTGTPALIASRYTVMGKSPLTGTWGDANAGGYFGPTLKFAGYDAIFFFGISEKPVYLFIDNGKAELRDATKVWGKETRETEAILKAELGKDVPVTCIGPAGEKCSLISCIINDGGRAAGRSGLGAVMGSKKLKAIALRGNLSIPLADREETLRLRKKYLSGMSGLLVDIFQDYGTCGIMKDAVDSGDAPIKNWGGDGKTDFPNAAKISDENVIRYQVRKYGCYGCPLQCGGRVKVEKGPYKSEGRKPEFETLGAFGPLCLNDNIESIIKANEICDRYGVDTVSTGSTIAFAIECYDKGIITKKDTDGIELTWGNHEAIIELTEKIAKREGFGEVLADGVKKAAERIGNGAEEYAIHVQGQELPMHHPKKTPGYATTYKIDSTPGRHTQGGAANAEGFSPEGMELPEMKEHTYSGKGEIHKKMSNFIHSVNCAGLCLFGITCIDVNSIPQFIHSVVGWECTMDEFIEMGERIANIRHAFNLREGLNPLEFKIPKRVITKSQQFSDVVGGEVDVDVQVSDYLKAMEWDAQTGKPSKQRLIQLGLTDIADEIGTP